MRKVQLNFRCKQEFNVVWRNRPWRGSGLSYGNVFLGEEVRWSTDCEILDRLYVVKIKHLERIVSQY